MTCIHHINNAENKPRQLTQGQLASYQLSEIKTNHHSSLTKRRLGSPACLLEITLCSSITALPVAGLKMLHQHNRLGGEVIGVANLLLNLETINNRCKLAENLICLLVELELSSDQVSKISEGFGGIKHLGGRLAS